MCISRIENVSFEEMSSLFEYNPETGFFFRKIGVGSYRKDWTQGTRQSNGYRFFIVKGRKYLAHRLAFLLTHGRYPSGVIDHVNGIRSDNRIVNLRDVTQGENTKNSHIRLERKRKFSGYTYDAKQKKWKAEARIKGKRYSLGRFKTELEAHEAYVSFMKKHESEL